MQASRIFDIMNDCDDPRIRKTHDCDWCVDLIFGCRGLANKDRIVPLPGNMQLGSKPDPCCIAHLRSSKGKWFEVGRTEVVQSNLNPRYWLRIVVLLDLSMTPPNLVRFQKSIEVDFIFEINQEIRFVICDIDDAHSTKWNVETRPFNPHDHDMLGYLQTTLGDIVGSRNCQMSSALTGKRGKKEKAYGTITILAEEISYSVVSDFRPYKF